MKSPALAGFTRPTLMLRTSGFALAALALLLGGCANSYDMKVDAISRNKANAPKDAAPPQQLVSYSIHSINRENDTDSLRFKEAAKYVKTALSGKGLYEAPDPEKADLIVDLDYGIGPPKPHVEMESEPVYITIPGRVYTERVQVGTDRNGNPIYSTITTQEPPSTQYAGQREYQVLVVKYEKYMRLTARENRPVDEGKPAPEVWAVDITTDGESKNLRKYIPIMAAATIDYIGADTRGQKTVNLKEEKDGAVAFVKKGM